MLKAILAVVALLGAFVVYIYNTLVRRRAAVENGWSQIDVQLKRRYDLIPNLVETVKGYATHERDIFERVAALRSASMSATGASEITSLQDDLSSALRSLIAVSEGYPELKANANFLALQEELASTENKIAFARQYYNDAVKEYNIAIDVFPNNLLSRRLGFEPRPMWTAGEAAERAPVSVSWS
ncbi:MAG: LemA family protein [Aminobacteriaceae bacterium]